MLSGMVPWPEKLAARYRREGYWRGETFGELLRVWGQVYGSRTAVVGDDRRWSYAVLDTVADRLAGGLSRLGICRDERVIVQLPNIPEFVAMCFALFRIGALPIFALPGHRRSEIQCICDLSEAVAYVIPDVHRRFDYRTLAADIRCASQSLREIIVCGDPGGFTGIATLYDDPRRIPGPGASDVALFQLSGGTTGLPKLIPRTHDDYAYSVRASADLCRLNAESSYLAALPVGHNFPMSSPGILGTLYAGGKVVLADSSSPDDAFALIERERVTITALVPPVALAWLEAAATSRHDLSSLQVLQVGGARCSPETAARVRSTLGCSLQQVFGMAEGLVNYTRLDDAPDLVINTQGRPLSPADEIRVVDDDDVDVPPGQTGNLLTRGPYTVRGYYRAAEYNDRAFTRDGYYRTGDLVRVTPSGHLVVEGRAKDVINRGGDKVSAEEVQNHLLGHPAVHDVAVVSMPDRFLGERTCAYVISRGSRPALADLKTFLRERGLAEFKLPDRMEIVEEFPKTSVGKVDKKRLQEDIARKLELKGGGSGPPAANVAARNPPTAPRDGRSPQDGSPARPD